MTHEGRKPAVVKSDVPRNRPTDHRSAPEKEENNRSEDMRRIFLFAAELFVRLQFVMLREGECYGKEKIQWQNSCA
jgi:hypothetical protein